MSEIDHVYERIRARRAEIQRQREALEQEDRELAVTERHVARFLPMAPQPEGTQAAEPEQSTDRPIPSPIPLGVLAARLKEAIAPKASRAPRKPSHVPPILRMTRDVLREAAVSGSGWLDAQQITSEIRQRWWPEVEVAYVQPQLWRAAAKRGELRKDGTRYALLEPNEKGLAVEVARPFHQHGTAG